MYLFVISLQTVMHHELAHTGSGDYRFGCLDYQVDCQKQHPGVGCHSHAAIKRPRGTVNG